MKKVFLMVVALALISWGQAFATQFSFTFNEISNPTSIYGSGTLYGDDLGGGVYAATSGAGTFTDPILGTFTAILGANPGSPNVSTSPLGAFY